MTEQARPDTAALFVERLGVHLATMEAENSPADELRLRLARAMATADVQDAYGAFDKLYVTADRIRDAFVSLHSLLDGLEDQRSQHAISIREPVHLRRSMSGREVLLCT